MFNSIGNVCFLFKISNSMILTGREISVPTIESYLSALTDSYILLKAERYDIKGKEYLSIGYKYYIADIGLRYYLFGSKHMDMEHILKNAVYLELLRGGYKVYIGKIENSEVDFVAIAVEGTEYYQVVQSVLDERTLICIGSNQRS